MPLYRAQVTLAAASGTPQDAVQNVWHFIADDVTALGVAMTALNTFYVAIDGLLSNLLAASGHTYKCYDYADPEPRAPVLEGGLSSFTLGGASLPPEVAFCLSFQAPRQSGQPQARRRGRVYIGPIANSGLGTDGRPASAFLTTIGTAFDDLLEASEASAAWALAVYSRANAAAIEVVNGWYDNEWDTQRSRGRAATVRTIVN